MSIKKDSSVYLVAPPTLHLPSSGVSICLLSNDEQFQTQMVNMLEKGIKTEQLTFYLNPNYKSVDPKLWLWYWHVANFCDLVIVDSEHVTEHELRMAIAMSKNLPIIFRVEYNEELEILLKTTKIPTYSTIEQLDYFMEGLFID
jgi:hypothetical protein